MKKLWLFLFILISAPLISTETKVNTMGGVSYFLIDNSNVLIYPSLITNYPNEITAEITQISFYSFFKTKRWGIFGIGVNNDTVPSIVNTAIGRADFLRYSSISPQIAIYYGKKIHKLGSIGIKLSGVKSYYKKTIPEILSQSIKIYGGLLGLTLQLAKKKAVTIAGGVQRFGFNSHYEIGTGELVVFRDQGKYSYDGKIRILSSLSPTSLMVLGANYNKTNVSWEKRKKEKMITNETLVLNQVEGYGGINFTISTHTTLILGALFCKTEADTITIDKRFNTITYTLPQTVVAIETRIRDWIKIMTGASKYLNYLQVIEVVKDEEQEKEEFTETWFNLSVGLAIMLKNIELDAMIKEVITETSKTASSSISIVYKF